MANTSPQANTTTQLAQSAVAPRARIVFLAGLVALAALVAAWPSRNGQFLSGDDERLILNHFLVNHPSPQNAWTLLTKITDDLYQPLPMISFQLNYVVAGADPTGRFPISAHGFHLTNIVLHALNSVFIFLLVRRLTRCARIGALTGLLFACHPFAVEAAAWINGRMILLATTFSLLVLIVCLGDPAAAGTRPAPARTWLTAILAWLAALMSKVMPTVPLVAAWWRHRTCGRLTRRDVWLCVVLLAMAGAATGLAAAATINVVGPDVTAADGSTSAAVKMLLAFRYYLENYVWPNRLAAWSPPPQGTSVTSGSCLIAIVEAMGFVLLMLLARRFNQSAWLGLGGFVMLLLPFLAAGATRRFLAADRYMYLPILGLHMAVAGALVAMLDTLRLRISPAVARVTIGAPTVTMLAALAMTSRALVGAWTGTVARDQRIVQIYPDEPDARAQLAKAYLFENDPNAALRVIDEARRRWADNARLAGAAGEAYRAKKDWPAAERELRFASERMPEHLRTNFLYALTLDDLNKAEEAQARYETILRLDPRFLPAVTALARGHNRAGRADLAARFFERAIAINPYHRDCLVALAEIGIAQGRNAEAADYLQRILRQNPNDEAALVNLGVLAVRRGDGPTALSLYEHVLTINPSNLAARLNRAELLMKDGRTQEAESEFRRLLVAEPQSLQAAMGLHLLLQEQRRYSDVIRLWTDLRKANDSPEIRSWLVWAFMLADMMYETRHLSESIPAKAPEQAFCQWAVAFDALRRIDDGVVLQVLAQKPESTKIAAFAQGKRQTIVSAFMALPENDRVRPCATYFLGRALLIDGQYEAANRVLRPLVIARPMDICASLAAALLRSFDPTVPPQPDLYFPEKSAPH